MLAESAGSVYISILIILCQSVREHAYKKGTFRPTQFQLDPTLDDDYTNSLRRLAFGNCDNMSVREGGRNLHK